VRGYAAFGRGDVDALQHKFFAEDVRYHVPGRSPPGGNYKGVAQVLEWLGRQFELSAGTISAEVHDVLANDDHAVSLTTVRGERAGKELADNSVQVFHIPPPRPTCSTSVGCRTCRRCSASGLPGLPC
jgi:uncharacterized protein